MRLRSGPDGIAMANLGLLEPHVFRVKASGKVDEYMPQQFTFQVDKTTVSFAVARSIFGLIPEERVAFLIDTSCSMETYLYD